MSALTRAIALVEDGGMQSFDRLVLLAHLLLESGAVNGDVVELGCYRGKTAAFLACLTDKRLWLYDSFEGWPEPLPEETAANHHLVRGALTAFQHEVEKTFEATGQPQPYRIVRGFFKDILPEQLPEQIAFAHLDGDLFESISQSLALVYPRMVPGAYCVVDDYHDPNYPGAKKAVDAFMKGREPVREARGLRGALCSACWFQKR